MGVENPGGPRCIPCLFPAQQQDDLGVAFQTWMDTSGALRPEVSPGALPTWDPFLGETEIDNGPMCGQCPPRGLHGAFQSPGLCGISHPQMGVGTEAQSGQ